MKLTSQQWLIIVVVFLVFIVAMGVMAASAPKDVTETRDIILSTSTPKPDISTTGWWYAIPTDPSLPEMPKDGSPTPTDVP